MRELSLAAILFYGSRKQDYCYCNLRLSLVRVWMAPTRSLAISNADKELRGKLHLKRKTYKPDQASGYFLKDM